MSTNFYFFKSQGRRKGSSLTSHARHVKQLLSVKQYDSVISQTYFICTSGSAEPCVRLINLLSFFSSVYITCFGTFAWKTPYTLIHNGFASSKVSPKLLVSKQSLCLTGILPMKSTRIHSSSSFSLNSGSWLDKLLISPMSMLFNLWNITKAGTRLWLVGLYIQGSRHSSHCTRRVA